MQQFVCFLLLFYKRTSVTLLWLCADLWWGCFEGEARSLICLIYFYGQQRERKASLCDARLWRAGPHVTDSIVPEAGRRWRSEERRRRGGGEESRSQSISASDSRRKLLLETISILKPASLVSSGVCVAHPPVWMRRPAVPVLAGLSACLCCLLVGAAAAAVVVAAAAAKVQQLNYRPVIGKTQRLLACPCGDKAVRVRL